jgi:hypothetical protein
MNTDGKSCLIVGDIYSEFAKVNNAIIESDFIKMIFNGMDSLPFDELVLGQGLARASVSKIADFAQSHGIRCNTELMLEASLTLTHKHDIQNVMISTPVCLGRAVYKHQLIINELFDRLSDHVTGYHMGAMLLMEAGRQGVISTLELEFPAQKDSRWGYVLQRFNTEYLNYAFPVPTEIVVTLEKCDESNKRQIMTSLSIVFNQSETCISKMTMDVLLIEDGMLKKLEGKKAKTVRPYATKKEIINDESMSI